MRGLWECSARRREWRAHDGAAALIQEPDRARGGGAGQAAARAVADGEDSVRCIIAAREKSRENSRGSARVVG